MRRSVRILAVGIATLDHKAGNDSMKRRPIIETFRGQLRKVLHMPRGHIVKQPQHNLAQLCPLAADGNRGPCFLCRL